MGYIDFNGNTVDFNQAIGSVFKVESIRLPKNEMFPFPGDGIYATNPWGGSGDVTHNNRVFVSVEFYNKNGTRLFQDRKTSNYVWRVEGLNVYSSPLYDIAYYEKEEQFKPVILVGTLSEKPTYMKYSMSGDSGASYADLYMTYNVIDDEAIDADLKRVLYKKDEYTGFLEQIHDSETKQVIDGLADTDDMGRRLKAEIVRQINKARHGIRLGTYNVARYGQEHWYKIKKAFEDCAIDICGMQEVMYPLGEGTSYPKIFSEYFTNTWLFANASDNGDAYPKNERMLLTREGYGIDSTEETYLSTQSASGDHRYVAKSVVSLPRYMDKRGSENLKLSVYNTQLEVINMNTAQAQAREILSMAQADENPFIIIMGDTNDFTVDKKVWQIFREGGFEPVVDTNTSTVAGTYDFNCIDNFFLSSRIRAVDWDVIWSQEYPWLKGSATAPVYTLSDHNLVIADVVFDYSDIRCINTKLTNCSIDYTKGWLTDQETITITVTADSGYTLGTVSVLDCMMTNNDAVTINGGVITIDGSKLVGDVYISASAT